jgi:predicted Zn-dependent peptidase
VARGRLAAAEHAAPLAALATVLGERMGRTLRESRGLSYALGADATPLAGRVQWTAGMGILPDRLPESREGLREMILSLVSDPPDQDELDAAARGAHVRALMRGLSRINRAWKRCVDELRSDSRPIRAGGPGLSALRADEAAALARSLIDPDTLDAWVEAVVQRQPPAPAGP